jgi:peptidylprolyl isomerase
MLLIEALPNKNAVLTDLASSLSKITTEGSGNIRSIDSKGSKGIKPWPEVSKAARGAQGILSGRSKELLAGVKSGNEDAAQAELATLKASVDALGAAAEVQDRPTAVQAQVKALKALDKIGSLEQTFPFKPPTEEYPGIPQLLGRAEVEFTVRTGKTRQTRTMNAILDGYSAPLSTGHFVDLVQKKVFDKAPIINTDESSVTFAPAAKDAVKRNVPLEILVEGDKEPVYGESLEEQGRFKDKVVLPFSAYGTLAFQHSPDDVNSNSGTLFFLKSDPSYTPAGINTLDGAWSVLGYVVEGEDALDDLLAGDEVISVRVVDGAQNLKI